MNPKIKILAFLIVVLALDALLLTWQARRFHAAETLQDELVKKNAQIQSDISRFSADLKVARASQAQARLLASAPENGAKFIPVRIDAIKGMYTQMLAHHTNRGTDIGGPWSLQLSSDAIGWLGMTSKEADQVQNIFTQLQNHIEDHFRATAKEIPEDDADDRAKLKKAMLGTGQYSYYAIPPLDDDEVASLQKWLSDSVTNAIGPERADILTQGLATQYPWLRKNTRMLIGFRDIDSPPHGPVFTEEHTYTTTLYLTIETGITGTPTREQVLHFSRPVMGQPVPPELNFLFQPVTDNSSHWRKLVQ